MIDRITFSTEDLNYNTAPDCVMPLDDPIYNNLAAREAKKIDLPKIDNSNRGQIQRQQNIKPGTEEWFKLWFKGAR
jgi:hypothetical protein